MDKDEFREQMLQLMERKQHSAWAAFTEGRVSRNRLHVHFEQEYETYVRDFPVLLGRAYIQCPIPAVRRELAENIYEEETGGLSAGRPHPDLFLRYPKGLGMDLTRFEHIVLLPEAAAYRKLLDDATLHRGWEPAVAITTVFLEGTQYERGELDPTAPKRPSPPLSEHPLVKHYGLPIEHLELTRVHRQVEGGHRAAAWRMLLDHVAPDRYAPVLKTMGEGLERWLAYRTAVAMACGIT